MRQRARRLAAAVLGGLTVGLFGGPAPGADAGAAAAPGSSAADRAWERRAATLEGRLAPPEATERALAGYRRAIDAAAPGPSGPSDPSGSGSSDSSRSSGASGAGAEAGRVAARWKALRAAHYLSEFTTAPEERKAEAIREATTSSEESLAWLRRRLGVEDPFELEGPDLLSRVRAAGLDARDVAQLHFWSAIVWGAHGQRVGLLTIVREGIARRMYEDARTALRLDPAIERGGAHRLLSRLHADLPRVPFISGWVDREEALPEAERAFAVDPEDPGNQLILALAIRDFAPERSDEAEALLARAAGLAPRPALRAEDLAIAEEAAATLAELRDASD